MAANDSTHDRHSRQVRFAGIGAAGQARIAAATVAVVGCGALGSAVLDQLVRAGVGTVRCIDRDLVELSNLQRQGLYTAADAQQCRPKAIAAADRLRAIDPDLRIEPVVGELTARTVRSFIAGADVVIDGTDNFRTRHLINEACVAANTPWIYGACVGSYGLSLAMVPGQGPCLACLQDQLPSPGETPTCDTSGVIAPIVQVVAGWQVAEALKLLVGHPPRRRLWTIDVWSDRFQQVDTASWRDPQCPVCGPTPTWPQLQANDDTSITLCGRDAVQVQGRPLDPRQLAQRIGASVQVVNEWLVRWTDDGRALTAFADGRLLVHGVGDPAQARAIADRWLG